MPAAVPTPTRALPNQVFRESLSILVCEGAEGTRARLAEILRDRGHRVFSAGDGASALAVVARVRLHVALIDLELPDMSGYEVARRIRELAPGRFMRLIAVTAPGSTEFRAAAFRAGFDQHVTGPVNADELLDVIDWGT